MAVLGLALALPFAIWIITAAMASWLASEKGRSGMSWLLIGLVTGPIAILCVGLAPRGMTARYGECPWCREVISTRADRCPYCRERLGEDDIEENPYLPPGKPRLSPRR